MRARGTGPKAKEPRSSALASYQSANTFDATDLDDNPRRTVAADLLKVEVVDDALADPHQTGRIVFCQRVEDGRARLDVERDRSNVEVEGRRDADDGRDVWLGGRQPGRDVELERLVV